MHFSTPFFAAIAAFLAVGVQANPVASPEADITARTTFSGNAFWYSPNGNYGACYVPIQNSDYVVALSTAHWDAGMHCGQQVTVSYNGNSVDVTVGDLCPGCATDDIELTPAAFSVLAPLDVGVILVEWYFK